jgi:2-iminobutanoate/2-iminopropanoate deaminase
VKSVSGRRGAAQQAVRSGRQRAGGLWRSGNLVFVGGIGGWYPERRPDGPGDVRQQFSDALDSMKASLEQAGTSMALVLSVRVPLVNPAANEGPLIEVFNSYFPEPRPALSCFGAAGFRRPGQVLQVECIAYID